MRPRAIAAWVEAISTVRGWLFKVMSAVLPGVDARGLQAIKSKLINRNVAKARSGVVMILPILENLCFYESDKDEGV